MTRNGQSIRFKHRLRDVLDRAAAWSGIQAARERASRGELTILTYHRVLEDDAWARAPLQGLAMPRSAFAAQVEWLARTFTVEPLSAALASLSRAEPGTRPLAAITFDDGHRDSAEIAAPILERAGLRGTFFLVSDFVGSDRLLWFDCIARWHAAATDTALRALLTRLGGPWAPPGRPPLRPLLEALKSAPPGARHDAVREAEREVGASPEDRAMGLEQARQLARAGHEIGAHSVSHPILTGVDDASLDREVARCKDDVERLVGVPVRGFCYPNGSHDERVRGAVRRAGYAYGCATHAARAGRRDDPFALPRFNMNVDHVTYPRGVFSERRLRAELARTRWRE